MAKNDVQDFIELRHGFQGMADFSTAALRFLDRFGIAGGKAFRPSSNGASSNGAEHLREQVKRHYKKRRKHAVVAAAVKAYSVDVIAQRRKSLKVLEALDENEPRPPIHAGRGSMGSLVRRGYAKKAGKGVYLRTAKPYYVNPKKEQDAPEPPSLDALTVPQAAKRMKVSDSFVRLLIKQKRLTAHKDMVQRKGRKPKMQFVVEPAELARYQATAK